MKKNTLKLIALTLACILALPAGSAFGGTATSTLNVSATVTATCTINANPLNFGAYNPAAAGPLQINTTIDVTCTNLQPTVITLDEGANPAGGSTPAAPQRQMASGANMLAYNLFSDNAYSAVWGSAGVPNIGSGFSQSIPVYGQVSALQNVAAGNYTDAVVATITF